MKTNLKIKEIMTEEPVRISIHDTGMDAIKVMSDKNSNPEGIRHLPVIEEKQLVGIVSERDIRSLAGRPRELLHSEISCVMTKDVITVSPEDPVIKAVKLFVNDKRKIGALPVVSEGRKLVGIVSYIDVLNHCLTNHFVTPSLLEKEEGPDVAPSEDQGGGGAVEEEKCQATTHSME